MSEGSRRWPVWLIPIAGVCTGCATSGPGDTRAFLDRSWETYKETYLHPDGYVLDPERGAATSEGQGYALLRAAWMRDEATFDAVFRWTESQLRRPDGLYSWLWSPSDGVIDRNTAADGEQEIALALLIAADAFGVGDYRARAVEILQATRRHQWLLLPEGGVPAAGDWAVAERIVNPSYLIFYAYRLFHEADPEGGWLETRDAGYALLDRIGRDPRFRLPPDFLIARSDGTIEPLPEWQELSRDFSFDAIRIYWRLAADCALEPEGPGCEPGPGFDVLTEELRREGDVVVRYRVDGERAAEDESLSFYGALLPALNLHAPDLADRIREEKLTPDRLTRATSAADRYYDANWVWFGLAADAGLIPERSRRDR